MKITEMLLTYAPNFCWVTIHDLVAMLECVEEDISFDSVIVTLSRLKRTGKFITKSWPKEYSYERRNDQGIQPDLYLRVR